MLLIYWRNITQKRCWYFMWKQLLYYLRQIKGHFEKFTVAQIIQKPNPSSENRVHNSQPLKLHWVIWIQSVTSHYRPTNLLKNSTVSNVLSSIKFSRLNLRMHFSFLYDSYMLRPPRSLWYNHTNTFWHISNYEALRCDFVYIFLDSNPLKGTRFLIRKSYDLLVT
jgi:hypothetical protein